MEKHLMEEFIKILEKEETINNIQFYNNLLGQRVVTYWIDDTQYCLSIEEIFRK